MAYVDNLCQGLLLAAMVDAGRRPDLLDRRRPAVLDERDHRHRRAAPGRRLRPALHRRAAAGSRASPAGWPGSPTRRSRRSGLYHQKIHVLSEMNQSIACSVAKARRELGYRADGRAGGGDAAEPPMARRPPGGHLTRSRRDGPTMWIVDYRPPPGRPEVPRRPGRRARRGRGPGPAPAAEGADRLRCCSCWPRPRCYVVALKSLMAVIAAPQFDWTAGRLSPTYSLVRGFTLYYPARLRADLQHDLPADVVPGLPPGRRSSTARPRR